MFEAVKVGNSDRHPRYIISTGTGCVWTGQLTGFSGLLTRTRNQVEPSTFAAKGDGVIDIRKPLFKLGQVVSTPGALAALEEAGQAPWEFLSRHVQGDWGIVDQEDAEANDRSVEDGSRILSAYTLKTGEKIWVISEADRSSTCLLLPDEY